MRLGDFSDRALVEHVRGDWHDAAACRAELHHRFGTGDTEAVVPALDAAGELGPEARRLFWREFREREAAR